MLKVFLSYRFNTKGQQLAERIRSVLKNLQVKTVDGKSILGKLTDQIAARIKTCDALICVLNQGQDLRYVEAEAHFAHGLGIPIIVISDGNVPIKGLLSDHRGIQLSKGEFEAASDLVAAINEIKLKSPSRAVSRRRLSGRPLVTIQADREPFRKFLDLGMERIHDPLTDRNLRDRLASSKNIKVLKTWFPESTQIATGLERAINEHRARVRLLLCKPQSVILEQRSLGAHQRAWWGSFKVCEAIEDVYRWVKATPGVDVKIRCYDSWPGCPVIWCDDTILMGFYFRGRASPAWPWVSVKKDSRLAKILDDQFNDLWEDDNTEHLDTPQLMAKWLAESKKCKTLRARK